MNRNGTPAIILIYLMTMMPEFIDIKSQGLVDATSASAKINLYSTFQNRLNATSNLAESEYNKSTSETVNNILDLVGQILYEQLKEQQEKSDSQDGNYTQKLVDEADPSRSHDILPPAVASTAPNMAADVAKEYPELIDAQVVGQDIKQLDYRQARKIRKASHRTCPRPYRVKKSYYSEMNVAKGQSSRPEWENRRMRPSLSSNSLPMGGSGGAEKWQLSPISTKSQARHMDVDCRCRRSGNSKSILDGNAVDDVSGSETNELAERIGGGDDNNRHGLPSDRWRRKLKIDGRRKNLRDCRSWPNLLEEQSKELIEYDAEADEAEDERRRRSRTDMDDYGPRIKTRSADSFPEVFSKPLIDSSSLPVIGTGNGLNDVLKSANSMLTSVPNIASSPVVTNPDEAGQRTSKGIQFREVVPLEGLNPGPPSPNVPSDANTANLTHVMEKVLGELESLKECNGIDNTQPEGSPCDVIGIWNSEIIGLQFHMSLSETSPSSRTFVEGKKIDVETMEKVPPRRHELMDCDWYFTANTLKQVGGPLYITAQKTERYILATFAGLCKTCGGVPTIFGSWTFVYPAKDCQDVSLAVETKRDILRKNTLQAKRKHRLDKVGGKSKRPSCSYY